MVIITKDLSCCLSCCRRPNLKLDWANDVNCMFLFVDDDCFYYHSWRNIVVIAFGTLSSFLTVFVCLFVCWNKTRKTILRLLCWEGSKPPGSDHTRAEAQTTCVPKTAAQTTYLSIYGWHSTSWRAGSHPWTYASPIQGAPLTTERRPPIPCLTYWFWTGGEINDLVDRDRELPANKENNWDLDHICAHVPDSGDQLIRCRHFFSGQTGTKVYTASRHVPGWTVCLFESRVFIENW